MLTEYRISGAKQVAGSAELLEQRVLLINSFDLDNCEESKGVEYFRRIDACHFFIFQTMKYIVVSKQQPKIKSTP